MRSKNDISELVDQLRLPEGQKEKFLSDLFDWLKTNGQKTNDELAALSDPDIEALAAEFVDSRRGEKLFPRGRENGWIRCENKTSVICQIREIIVCSLKNHSKPIKKNQQKRQAAKTPRNRRPIPDNRSETAVDMNLFEVSDAEFHTAETDLPAEATKSIENHAESSSRRTLPGDVESRSSGISIGGLPLGKRSSNTTADRKSAGGVKASSKSSSKSIGRSSPTVLFGERPANQEGHVSSLNTTNGMPVLSTPVTPTISAGEKRRIDQTEQEAYPSPVDTHDALHASISMATPVNDSSPLDERRVRRRVSPTLAAADQSNESRPAGSQLISVRGKWYELDSLVEVADTVLSYIRRCETKSLQNEIVACTAPQKALNHARAVWFKDLFQDLESRIESLAADMGDGVRVVSSYCERRIDQDRMFPDPAAGSAQL